MTIEVKMPALSPTMEKGTLAKWLVGVGDVVKAGDLLAEIETDKAMMEFEAVDPGRVMALVVPEGTDDVPVGTVIATLSGEDDVAEPTGVSPVATDMPPPAPRPALPAPSASQATTPILAPPLAREQADPTALRARPRPEDKITVSPLAARIATAMSMDLSNIRGTGPNGRIVRADLPLPARVVAGQAMQAAAPVAAVASFAPPPEGVPFDCIKLSGMRRTIARRLTDAKQTVPHFYLTVRCKLDALIALRTELNASLSARNIRLSVNDLLIKAMAIAMAEVSEANVQFAGDEMYQFKRVDISMAVAIEGGLITPVIRDVASLSLAAVSQQSKVLSAKARDGKLQPEDYQGGTASISNLGMFGIDEIVPVINPPQAVIMGIGATVEQPWKVDGAIALTSIMSATASFDHRAIDGAVGARFMATFRELLETPTILLT